MIDKLTSAATIVTDSLRNVVANLNTGRDKASATEFVFDPMLDQQLIEAYRGSWLPRAIVDIPAEDSCRKWRQWKAEAPQIEKIEKLEKKLGLSRQIEACYKMARLMGRAYLYISTNEVDPSKPLRTDRVREIRGLPMLTKLDLKPEAMVRDIDSPYYGKAEYYKLNRRDGQAEVRIHASRLVVLEGNSVPSSYGAAGYQDSPLSGVYGDDWCDSVLQSVMDAVKAHDSMLANIVSLIFEAKINVYKFDGFSDQLVRDKGAAIQSRLSLQTVMKGINGDVVIDAKDDFQQRNASFGGLDALLDRAGYIVCGAAEIPYTRVFGRSAAGLSGQGDGDERVYYDRINHIQTNSLEPAMALLDECVIQIALGSRPPEIWFEWRPLRQVSEQERATIFKTTADAARALAGAQAGELIPIEALSDALINEFVEQGVLPGLETSIAEYGNLAELAAEIDGGEDNVI